MIEIELNNTDSKMFNQGTNNKNDWYKLKHYYYIITEMENSLAVVISSQHDKEANSGLGKLSGIWFFFAQQGSLSKYLGCCLCSKSYWAFV